MGGREEIDERSHTRMGSVRPFGSVDRAKVDGCGEMTVLVGVFLIIADINDKRPISYK